MLTNQEGTWFNHQETLFHSHDAREDPDSNALKGIDWDLEGELVLPILQYISHIVHIDCIKYKYTYTVCV